MNKKSYLKLMDYYAQHPKIKNLCLYSNKIITYFIFAFYPLFLCYLVYIKNKDLIYYILFPLVSFIVLSVFRHFFNAKRPYEKYNADPITSNAKSGKSFPSRHVFSAFVIAFMMLHFNISLGLNFLSLAFILACLRVLCGVHFIKDVFAGAAFALLTYLLMILII